jgi:alkanesulfonate monooxygenase SsuD/methylene tetrahydromethanopterin reductase-like flavin-dependent oxidoreductase (luciferase family)
VPPPSVIPGSALRLEINLRAEHDPAHRRHIAHLAGRLGFASIWLPAPEGPPSIEELRTLITATRPARLGLVVDGDPAGVSAAWLGWIAATRDDAGLGTVFLDLPLIAVAGVKPAIVTAVGSRDMYRNRVLTRGDAATAIGPDLEAAGYVVNGSDRATVAAQVTKARDARAAAGRAPDDFPITVDLTVAIGRTMREAEVRADRDPLLSGEQHPRDAGLFGTLEHAQEQVLDYARAGADGLRATLADERDVADLLAQFRSLAVGPVPFLLTQVRDATEGHGRSQRPPATRSEGNMT